MTTIIETERLTLRTWQEQDADAYFQINKDPKVIEFLRGPLTMKQVNDSIPAVNRGYTLWAAEQKETGELMGFVGLNYTDWESNFTPLLPYNLRRGFSKSFFRVEIAFFG
jgi:RimJ/RimL family protein N-acetyltransferase